MRRKSFYLRGMLAVICLAAAGSAVGQPSSLVSFRTVVDEDAFRFGLHVDAPDRIVDGEMATFLCVVTSRGRSEEAVLRMQVFAQGQPAPLFQGVHPLSLKPGEFPARFDWTPGAIAEGAYSVVVDLTVPNEPDTARVEFAVRKRTSSEVSGALAGLRGEAEALRAHFLGLGEPDQMPYARLRLGVALEALRRADADLAAGEWASAGAMADFVEDLLAGTKAQATFGRVFEGSVGLTAAPMRDLAVQDGLFFSEGQAVFPFGMLTWLERAGDLGLLDELGMRLAAFPVGPDSPPTAIDRAIAAAAESKLAVSFLAVPPGKAQLPASAAWLRNERHAVTEAGAAVDAAWLRGLAEQVDRHGHVMSVSVLHRPAFSLESETTRQGFIEYLRQFYPDRDALNRVWRSRFKNFEDVSLAEDHPRPAFTFDLTTYRMGMANELASGLANTVRHGGPSLLVQVSAAPAAFTEDSTATAQNDEWLSRVTDIAGVAGPMPVGSDRYALNHPHNTIHYTLQDSMAPAKPVFDTAMFLFPDALPEDLKGRHYAHAAVWDAVIAGLDGGAAWAWTGDGDLPASTPGLVDHLDRLEGYATAALDTNRLAPVIASMHRAPAEVGILWSMSSLIFDGGKPFAASAMRAYEGMAFSGQKVRFVSESQCVNGGLAGLRLLVIPQTPALSDAAFAEVDRFIKEGGYVIRTGLSAPYDPRGLSRQDVISYTTRTYLIRGTDDAVGYLHACETAYADDALAQIPRSVNEFGYLLEGVKSRYVVHDGVEYLFLLNVRKTPVSCHLSTPHGGGEDKISGTRVAFPMTLAPLRPMLVALDSVADSVQAVTVTPVASVPAATVR